MSKTYLLRLLRKVVKVHDSEVSSLLCSSSAFFCILGSYFVLVPLREEAGISLGTDALPKLFTASLVGVLLVTPLASTYVARASTSRRVSLRNLYIFLGAMLLMFYILLVTTLSTQQLEADLTQEAVPAAASLFIHHTSSATGPLPPILPLASHLADGSEKLSYDHLALVAKSANILADRSQKSTKQTVPFTEASVSSVSRSLRGIESEQVPSLVPLAEDSTIATQQLQESTEAVDIALSPPRARTAAGDTKQRWSPRARALIAAFYIWLNIQNLVATSAMWSRCADVFSADAAQRLFGFISAGATAGQLSGSVIAMVAAGAGRRVEDAAPAAGLLPWLRLMPLSALLYCGAALAAYRLRGAQPEAALLTSPRLGRMNSRRTVVASAQRLLSGATLICNSPYLLLVCGYLMLAYMLGASFYFQRALIISATLHDAAQRVTFFARLTTASGTLIALLQLCATGRVLAAWGLPAVLALYPLVSGAGLVAILLAPVPSTVAIAEVLRKMVGYAMIKPAREVLFTVVSREEKYRAKMWVDTVVQRLGDTLAATMFEILNVRLSLGIPAIAVASLLLCTAWCIAGFQLGRTHRALLLLNLHK